MYILLLLLSSGDRNIKLYTQPQRLREHGRPVPPVGRHKGGRRMSLRPPAPIRTRDSASHHEGHRAGRRHWTYRGGVRVAPHRPPHCMGHHLSWGSGWQNTLAGADGQAPAGWSNPGMPAAL